MRARKEVSEEDGGVCGGELFEIRLTALEANALDRILRKTKRLSDLERTFVSMFLEEIGGSAPNGWAG